MGDFSSLKKYGKKVYKFQQDKLIDQVSLGDTINPDIATVAQSGICAAVVVRWAKDVMYGMGAFGSHEINGRVGYIVSMFERQEKLLRITSNGMFEQYFFERKSRALDLGAMALFENNCDFNARKLGDYYKLEYIIPSFQFRADRSYFVATYYKNSETGELSGHAIGIFKSPQGGFVFFDPNAGEYHVRQNEFKAFLNEYWKIMRQKEVVVKNTIIELERKQDVRRWMSGPVMVSDQSSMRTNNNRRG